MTLSKESETKTDSSIEFKGTYETEEEAQNKKDEKEKEYNEAGYENIKSEITVYTTTEETGNEIEEYTDSTIATETDAYVFDTEEEAQNKKDELENSTNPHDVVITVTINKRTVDTGEDETSSITKTFNSREEAEAYIESLKEEGYEVISSSITQDSHTEEVTLSNTFETKTEAEQALSEFENTYDNVQSEGVKENKTDTVIETIDGTTPYETKTEAEQALEEFLNDPANETDEFYFTGEVTGPTGTGEYETTTINEKFNSEEEALAYIENLENEGYTISNYSFTKDTTQEEGKIENEKYSTREEAEQALENFKNEYPNDVESSIEEIQAGTVYEAHTITEDMKIYQIGSTTYILIKKGHEYFIWTENELTAAEQAQFKKTYKEVATDNVITGDVIASHGQFIYGYNITYHTSNGKSFRFVLDEDNEIKIIMDSGAESRVVYGTFEPVNQYVLNATGKKDIELESGTLTGEKSIEKEGYYYNLTKKAKNYSVEATGTETVLDDTYSLEADLSKDIMKDEYALDVTTETKNYTYSKETIEKNWYYLVVNADIPKEETKKTSTDKKVEAKEKVSTNELANPETSDGILKYFALILTSFIGLVSSIIFRNKKEN